MYHTNNLPKIILLIMAYIGVSSMAKDNGYADISTAKFQTDSLKLHNYYRKLHGAPPLKHSAKLEDFARRRAVEIAKEDGSNFYHPDDLIYGENLAWNSIENVDPKIPIGLWYDEWKIYNFNKPNITPKNGHFTQLVWKESAKVGCGRAISRKGSKRKGGTYTVCNYDPPGNYIGEELANVKTALKKKSTTKPKTTPKSKFKPKTTLKYKPKPKTTLKFKPKPKTTLKYKLKTKTTKSLSKTKKSK